MPHGHPMPTSSQPPSHLTLLPGILSCFPLCSLHCHPMLTPRSPRGLAMIPPLVITACSLCHPSLRKTLRIIDFKAGRDLCDSSKVCPSLQQRAPTGQREKLHSSPFIQFHPRVRRANSSPGSGWLSFSWSPPSRRCCRNRRSVPNLLFLGMACAFLQR